MPFPHDAPPPAGTHFLDARKNGKKRKASEMDGIDASPSAAKKRAKPTPRVTKGRVKGEHHMIKNSHDISNFCF